MLKKTRIVNKPKTEKRDLQLGPDVRATHMTDKFGGVVNALLTDEGERILDDDGVTLTAA